MFPSCRQTESTGRSPPGKPADCRGKEGALHTARNRGFAVRANSRRVNSNSAYRVPQAAAVLFTAGVGARKGCPSEVCKRINPKCLLLSHSLAIAPWRALLACFVTAWQQLSPYLQTYMPRHCSYLSNTSQHPPSF